MFSNPKGNENNQSENREAEQKFIKALRKKKIWAYEKLYDDYAGMVGGIAKSFLKADDVEDVIQEVFMRVYKSIRKFKGDSAFSTWLYRITVNICKDILKKYSRRSETFTDFDDDEPGGIREPSSDIDIEEQISKEMKIQDFKNILNQLSEEDNLFITLRDIEGLGYEEIGNVVGKPIGTVKSRIYYARKRLKKLLQQNDIGN